MAHDRRNEKSVREISDMESLQCNMLIRDENNKRLPRTTAAFTFGYKTVSQTEGESSNWPN